MSSDRRMIYRRRRARFGHLVKSATDSCNSNWATLMNDVVRSSRSRRCPDNGATRADIGLISASNKHTKFGAVFGVD